VLRSRRQTEKGGESFWDAEQLDGNLAICRSTRIAHELRNEVVEELMLS
jgi:hypothetical protein